jgi:hypothetical protein
VIRPPASGGRAATKGASRMAATGSGETRAAATDGPPAAYGRSPYDDEQGAGWIVFAGVMIGIAGILNVIYGIAAIGNSKFFVHDTAYVFNDLNTWGWVLVVVGALEILAAFSIWRGGTYGRIVGVIIAALSAIAALLSIPAYPFWALTIFAIDVLVIYGLVTYGGDRRIVA